MSFGLFFSQVRQIKVDDADDQYDDGDGHDNDTDNNGDDNNDDCDVMSPSRGQRVAPGVGTA